MWLPSSTHCPRIQPRPTRRSTISRCSQPSTASGPPTHCPAWRHIATVLLELQAAPSRGRRAQGPARRPEHLPRPSRQNPSSACPPLTFSQGETARIRSWHQGTAVSQHGAMLLAPDTGLWSASHDGRRVHPFLKRDLSCGGGTFRPEDGVARKEKRLVLKTRWLIRRNKPVLKTGWLVRKSILS